MTKLFIQHKYYYRETLGWQATQCSSRKKLFEPGFIQVMFTKGNHWITVTNAEHQSCEDATSIFIYDSLKYLTIEHKLKCDVTSIVHSQLDNLKFNVMNVDGQLYLSDSGVYAVAYATHLAFGLDPSHCLWDHKRMRGHLLSCLEDGEMTCFPSKGDRSIHTRRRVLKYVIERIYCSCRMPND